jgi:hypothetical protein
MALFHQEVALIQEQLFLLWQMQEMLAKDLEESQGVKFSMSSQPLSSGSREALQAIKPWKHLKD